MTPAVYSALVTKVKSELDLFEETFITDAELLIYFNEGLAMVSSLIHTIYEDYFMVKGSITLVSGTQDYALPSDIYAQKIRRLLYNDSGANQYDIKQIRNLSEIPFAVSTDNLRYIITNEYTSGPRISFYPTPSVSGNLVTIFYLRDAKAFTGSDSDTCDCFEFSNVVVQYVKVRCMEKEGHPDLGEATSALDQLKMLMVETLTNRVVDEDTEILKDYSFYRDFDSYWHTGRY